MINEDDLMAYLHKIDASLSKKITLVAVGGTAMTLYGLKESTKDVDFCVVKKEDFGLITAAAKKAGGQFRLDLFSDGYIYILQLPEDYAAKSRPIKKPFENLQVKLLNPVDVILTKTSRLNERDLEDIKELVSKKRIDKHRLIERYDQVKDSYAGPPKAFQERFEQVLKAFF